MKRVTILSAVGVLAVSTMAAGVATAVGAPSDAPAAASAEIPYAVEDFGYPQAEEILKTQKIKLKKGNGNIVLVACDSKGGLLEVWSSQDAGSRFCFEVTGPSGYLTLELPSVYGVKGIDRTVSVDMNVPGTATDVSFDVTKGQWTPVGITADPQKREHTLVEIRTGA
ncbi:hypothetical protein ACFWDI_15795 [Streptomyces sp. NPDC060064]|uniref:hypothetical protein n=1 Tax=Streptomyces sp. NPDC060064 TaxID=3347049 RepID=UPI00368E253C